MSSREEVATAWLDAIESAFPRHLEADFHNYRNVDGGFTIDVDWEKAENNRPNKRSVTIRIIISREAIDDCQDHKTAADRLRSAIVDRLVRHNPNSDHTINQPPPIEKWVISTFEIN